MDEAASPNVIISMISVTGVVAIEFGDGQADHEQERRQPGGWRRSARDQARLQNGGSSMLAGGSGPTMSCADRTS